VESTTAAAAAVASAERCYQVPVAGAVAAVVDSEPAADRPSVAAGLSTSSAADGVDTAGVGAADTACAAAAAAVTQHCCQQRLGCLDAAVTLPC